MVRHSLSMPKALGSTPITRRKDKRKEKVRPNINLLRTAGGSELETCCSLSRTRYAILQWHSGAHFPQYHSKAGEIAGWVLHSEAF